MGREKKPLPINKRWPGRYAFRVACYTPKGGCLEFEVPADDAKAKAILGLPSELFNAPEPTT